MNVKEQTLTREEMKNIMAGSGDYCGDIYCDVGGGLKCGWALVVVTNQEACRLI